MERVFFTLRLRLRLRWSGSHVRNANASANASARKWKIFYFLRRRLRLRLRRGSSHVYLLVLAFAFASLVWTGLKAWATERCDTLVSSPSIDKLHSVRYVTASRGNIYDEVEILHSYAVIPFFTLRFCTSLKRDMFKIPNKPFLRWISLPWWVSGGRLCSPNNI